MPNGVCISYPNAGVCVPDLRLHPREIIRGLETAVTAARKQSDRGAEGRHLGQTGPAQAMPILANLAHRAYQQATAIFRDIEDRRGKETPSLT